MWRRGHLDRIHVDLRLGELQVAEEDTVEVVVVVLSGMGQNHIEYLRHLEMTAATG